MRECSAVIKEILELVPKENQPFINDLMWNYEDSCYKAPEEVIQWERTYQTLQKHINVPKQDWEFEILSIFSTIPVEDLKEHYKTNKG